MNPRTNEIPYVPHPAVPDFAQPHYTAGNGQVRDRACPRVVI